MTLLLHKIWLSGIFIILILSSHSYASNNCQFMVDAQAQIENAPQEVAQSNFQNGEFIFYAAGTGIAAAKPGFDTHAEFNCVDSNYPTETIWVGGDLILCKGQLELGQKVQAWVEEYNVSLKSLLIKSGSFKCGM